MSGQGETLGVGALAIAIGFVVVGFGLWQLKNRARMATIILAAIGCYLSLARYPFPFHIARVPVNVAILSFLLMPNGKRLFVPV